MQDTRQELKTVEIGWIRLDFSTADRLEDRVRLSETDRDRAERFKRREDRIRFMAGRALLTLLLGEAETPVRGVLELAWTEHRRPFLPSLPGVSFSISHAGDLAGVALAQEARVGLDIESPDRQVDLPSLAARIFGPDDWVRFQALPASEQPHAFFRAWTGKEAVLKAQGVGLFGGIETIPARFHDEPATIELPDNRETWRLHPLPLPGGYLGSVACDDPSRRVRHREVTLDQLIAG